jgi:hypothetical protein
MRARTKKPFERRPQLHPAANLPMFSARAKLASAGGK